MSVITSTWVERDGLLWSPLLERYGIGLEFHDRGLLDRLHRFGLRFFDRFDHLEGFGWRVHPTSFICWFHNCR